MCKQLGLYDVLEPAMLAMQPSTYVLDIFSVWMQGNLQVVQYLLSRPGVHEQRGSLRRLPVAIACTHNHADIVQLLLHGRSVSS